MSRAIFSILCCCIATAAAEPLATTQPSKPSILFLGDSITDEGTYILLVKQALRDAGKPDATLINCGAGGNTAREMFDRIDRDVLPANPTTVFLSSGPNDHGHKVAPTQFRADMKLIVDKLQQAHIPVVLMTTCVQGPDHAADEVVLDQYCKQIHSLADEYGLKVADVNAAEKAARQKGIVMVRDDQVHPTFQGAQAIARAILDAMGDSDVQVPEKLAPLAPLPGVISPWRMQLAGPKEPRLADESAATLAAGDGGTLYTLPETDDAGSWKDQQRQRGFAINLEKNLGKLPSGAFYRGVATISADGPKTVYFNTGGDLQTLFVNGQKIYEMKVWHGWHPGRDHIEAKLHAGSNSIVIEVAGEFFLSATDSIQW